MNDDERRVIEELRHDYTPVAENIWLPLELHAGGLQPGAERDLLAALREATQSSGPSPMGLVLNGQKGAGKTHLLHWFREQVHANRGYFFLVALLDAKGFWDSVILSVMDGLRRPWGGERTQAQVLLYQLGEELGASLDLHGMLIGSRPVSPEALGEFERLLMTRDRLVAQTVRATARALVLFVSRDFAHQDIAETYFQSEEDEPGVRRQWGLPRKPRSPEELLRDLTMLMSLTGPVVIAVDQIDTLISQSIRSLRDGEDDQAAQYLLLEQIGGGLMSLRERTRRTLTVVACTPSSWLSIKEHATDTVADRFRETTQLRTLPDAGVARNLVGSRFAKHFADAAFTPPFPTWPVADGAFDSAVHYTPRRVLAEIDRHLRACEAAGEITLLQRFGDDSLVVPPIDRPPHDAIEELDTRFAALRSAADPAPLRQGAHEDDHWPATLLAGLWAWVIERGERREEYSVDPLPGQKPSIHARLRQILDEETEDQVYWSFRAIAADHHHRAALSRLKKACTAAALSDRMEGRWLVVLRDGDWSSGSKTQEAVAAFEAAGGRAVPPSDDDARSLLALRALRDEKPKFLDEWLEIRQIATSLGIFADLPVDGSLLGGPSGGPASGPSSSGPETAPATGSRSAPRAGKGTGRARNGAPGPSETGDVIPVGVTIDGGEMVSVRLHELRKHVAIFAGSGSGKTVLIRRIVEECALRGVSAIVLDPNNDLARLGDRWPERPALWSDDDEAKAEAYLAGTEIVVWTPGREAGRPLTFQPLPDFSAVRDDADEFGDAVAVAVSALEPRVKLDGKTEKVELRRAVLRQAVEHLGRSGGGSLQDLARLLGDLPYGVSDLADAKKIGAILGQLLTAAMVNDPLFGGTGEAMDPGLLLTPAGGKRARISVVSLVGLPGDPERQAFVNQLQMALFAWIRRHPAGDRPLGGLLVMDEAQNFAPSGSSTPSTRSTLALASQARKYGLGLVFATQAPKGLHNQIPGNASTQFFGKLNAPAQVSAAKEMAAAKGGDVSDVSRLGVGQFYASFESGGFVKLRAPMCLSHHPSSPLTTEEVVARARAGR